MVVLLAVLALAGAPANANVVCSPLEVQPAAQATTFFNGAMQPQYTVLGAGACAAELDSPAALYATLNPTPGWDYVLGNGTLALLVEAVHWTHAYQSDETNDECRAFGLLPALLHQYLSGDDYTAAYANALFTFTNLPASIYHTHPC